MKRHPTGETDIALWSLIKNTDEIYGDGFRELLDIYDIRGFKAVIEYIKQWKKQNREGTAERLLRSLP